MGKITIVDQFFMVGSGFVFLLLETPDLFFLFFPGPKKVTFRFFSWKDNPDFFLVKTARCDIFWSKLNSDFAVLFLMGKQHQNSWFSFFLLEHVGQKPPISRCPGRPRGRRALVAADALLAPATLGCDLHSSAERPGWASLRLSTRKT
jgi:hypothetical protein